MEHRILIKRRAEKSKSSESLTGHSLKMGAIDVGSGFGAAKQYTVSWHLVLLHLSHLFGMTEYRHRLKPDGNIHIYYDIIN